MVALIMFKDLKYQRQVHQTCDCTSDIPKYLIVRARKSITEFHVRNIINFVRILLGASNNVVETVAE